MLHAISLFVSLLFHQLLIENSMDDEFCHALMDNDRIRIKKAIDPYLKTLDVNETQIANFDKIKVWLEGQDCVESVVIEAGLLDREPPVKVFFIVMNNQPKTSTTLGVEISSDKYQYDYK